MTIVNIDLAQAPHLDVETVKKMDFKFVDPTVATGTAKEFTVPYNPRGESNYSMVLDLHPGQWEVLGDITITVPQSSEPVNFVDIINTQSKETPCI